MPITNQVDTEYQYVGDRSGGSCRVNGPWVAIYCELWARTSPDPDQDVWFRIVLTISNGGYKMGHQGPLSVNTKDKSFDIQGKKLSRLPGWLNGEVENIEEVMAWVNELIRKWAGSQL